MTTKVQKWGNSQGLRLPRHILEDANISIGDDVDVSVKGGEIIISPVKRIHGKYKLQDILSRIPKDYVPEEIDWGKPVGKEVW